MRQATASLAACILFVLGYVCAGAQDGPGNSHPSVVGTVTDAESGNPVANAIVYSPAVQETTQTDAQGHYAFERLPEGVHTLIAFSAGRATLQPAVVTIKPAETAEVDLVLGPCGTVSGVITDESEGRPLVGARIIAMVQHSGIDRCEYGTDCSPFDWFDADLPLHTVSDEKGRFSIPLRIPATRELVVHAEDYEEARIDLVKSAPDAPLHVRLSRGCVISGRALDPDGKPLAEAMVLFALDPVDPDLRPLWEFPPGSCREITGKDGRFVLGGLPAGTYYMAAYHHAYARAKLGALKLKPKEAVDGVDLRLSAGATIAGRVTDEEGNPVAGAWVWFKKTDVEGDPFAEMEELEELADEYSTTTARGGTYVSPPLPAGKYAVAAPVGGRSYAGARTILVKSGMAVKGVDFGLPPPRAQ